MKDDNGKIISTGNFDNVNGVSRIGVARIDITGVLDDTFHIRSERRAWDQQSSFRRGEC